MSEFKPAVFYKEVKEELTKVNWPSKEQTLETTAVVLAVVVLLTAYLGGLDFVLGRVAAAIMGS
jgi:preprotein translocase subunit SecE